MSSIRLPFFITGQDFGERLYAIPDYVSFCHVYNLSIRNQHAAWLRASWDTQLMNTFLIFTCLGGKEKKKKQQQTADT